MTDPTDSLARRFAALEAARARDWSPAQRAANAAQRAALVAGFDPAAAVRPGDRIDDAPLLPAYGESAATLGTLVAHGPAVLIFFRFAACPADNLALPHYDAALSPTLAAAGVPLVAISPQRPDRLAAIGARHALRLAIAGDPDNRLARGLGLAFTPLDTPSPPPPGWIGEITGTGHWELPLTSVLIVDAGRVARFVAVSPDWLDRIEAPAILAGLAALRAAPCVSEA